MTSHFFQRVFHELQGSWHLSRVGIHLNSMLEFLSYAALFGRYLSMVFPFNISLSIWTWYQTAIWMLENKLWL